MSQSLICLTNSIKIQIIGIIFYCYGHSPRHETVHFSEVKSAVDNELGSLIVGASSYQKHPYGTCSATSSVTVDENCRCDISYGFSRLVEFVLAVIRWLFPAHNEESLRQEVILRSLRAELPVARNELLSLKSGVFEQLQYKHKRFTI